MKAYIPGCGGMLGDALYHLLISHDHAALATDINQSSPWINYGNVRDPISIYRNARAFRPDVIINLAAMTDLEQCEAEPFNARETNSEGSLYCALIAKQLRIPYVYISTAGIFDGKKDYYEDNDYPNPLGVYAKSKYEGELYAQRADRYIVLRCGWAMGSGPKDKKFIQKIWKQIRSGATELHVVTDKSGSPTYVKDFARQIVTMIEAEQYGVFNAAGIGDASRYEVAVEFVRLLGLEDRVKVSQTDSNFFAAEYSAPRPASEKLLDTKLNTLGLNMMRPWKECLAEYVQEYADYFSMPKERLKCSTRLN